MGHRLETFLYNQEKVTNRLQVATVAMQCDQEPTVNLARVAQTIEAIVQAHPDVELVV